MSNPERVIRGYPPFFAHFARAGERHSKDMHLQERERERERESRV
jgi:hypothetical protein